MSPTMTSRPPHGECVRGSARALARGGAGQGARGAHAEGAATHRPELRWQSLHEGVETGSGGGRRAAGGGCGCEGHHRARAGALVAEPPRPRGRGRAVTAHVLLEGHGKGAGRDLQDRARHGEWVRVHSRSQGEAGGGWVGRP
eukprot:657021-Prorocentrum_lima.AAC.1